MGFRLKKKKKKLTCQANKSCTCFAENPFFKEFLAFLGIEGLIVEIFFGVRRRDWPIPIGYDMTEK